MLTIASKGLVIQIKNALGQYFLIDLPDLLGRQKIEQKGFKTFSLIEFKGK